MKLPIIIYIYALGLYLLFTLPTIVFAEMYIISAVLAVFFGFAALLVFTAVFYVLHKIKPSPTVVKLTLFAAVLLSVAAAYQAILLLTDIDTGRTFWQVDGFTLFPMVAVLAGWVAIAISTTKINAHFSPPVIEEFETIFSS